jgi:hypothetical protein
MQRILYWTVGLLAFGLIFGAAGHGVAQNSLRIGGSDSNFGAATLRGGFPQDPHQVHVVSGGSLNVSNMGHGSGCVGYVTRKPDFILHYNNAASFLRLFVRAGGDTSLIINDAGGRWHCNDDSSGLNPMVDIQNPPSGQYDIWVGSYEAGANISGNLFITELHSQHP